jgi:hypothetical protein
MEQLGQIQWKYSGPTRRIRSNFLTNTSISRFNSSGWFNSLSLGLRS